MSYCRWSSNNWDCDLYCYEDCGGGYTTHVGSARKVGETPCPSVDIQLLLDGKTDEYWAAYKAQNAWFDAARCVKIGLPQDGQSFNDATLGEFLDRVVWLRDMGYHVPEYVIEDIKAELATPQMAEIEFQTNIEDDLKTPHVGYPRRIE